MEKEPYIHTVTAKVLNSGISAIVSTVIMYPLDFCKTRIQNQRNTADGIQLYTGLVDAFRKIRQSEGGMRGMYRGCGVAVALIAPEKTLKLLSNDLMRHSILRQGDPMGVTVAKEIISGGFAGACQCLLSTPMDLLKINMQDAGRLAAVSKTNFEGSRITARKVLKDLLKKQGFLGLYRGGAATLGRNIVFSLIYFPAFFALANFEPYKKNADDPPSSYWAFISGMLAGALSAASATPFDVAKTRIQRLKLAKCDVPYKGVGDAFVQIFRTEGAMALMKGAAIRMASIAPMFGILQAIYYVGIGEAIVKYVRARS